MSRLTGGTGLRSGLKVIGSRDASGRFIHPERKLSELPPSLLQGLDLLPDVKAEDRFIFGTRKVPTISDIGLGAIGLKSGTDIRADIKKKNDAAIQRGKALTYLQSIGADVPPRVALAGGGTDAAKAALKLIKAPVVPPGFALPEVLTFVPTTGARTRFSNFDVEAPSTWTPAQRLRFVMPDANGQSDYVKYLNSGGEPIPVLQRTLALHSQFLVDGGVLDEDFPTTAGARGALPQGAEETKEETKEATQEETKEATQEETKEATQEETPRRRPGRPSFLVPKVLPGGITVSRFNDLARNAHTNKNLGLKGRMEPADLRRLKNSVFKKFLEDYVAAGGDITDQNAINRGYRKVFNEKINPITLEPRPEQAGSPPSGDIDVEQDIENALREASGKITDPNSPEGITLQRAIDRLGADKPRPGESEEDFLLREINDIAQIFDEADADSPPEEGKHDTDFPPRKLKEPSAPSEFPPTDKPFDFPSIIKSPSRFQDIRDTLRDATKIIRVRERVGVVTLPEIGTGGKTATVIRERPIGNGSRTEEEEEKEEEKRRRRPPIPIPPRDPRDPRDPREPEPRDTSGPVPKGEVARVRPIKAGHLRPLFERGGQSILAISDKERLQEIVDWDLYDIPIPDSQDLQNPLFRNNIRQANFRHFGSDGRYRPSHFYQPTPRSLLLDRDQLEVMQPTMKGSFEKGAFADPYNREPFNNFAPAYRTAQSFKVDVAQRASNIYPDIINSRIAALEQRMGVKPPIFDLADRQYLANTRNDDFETMIDRNTNTVDDRVRDELLDPTGQRMFGTRTGTMPMEEAVGRLEPPRERFSALPPPGRWGGRENNVEIDHGLPPQDRTDRNTTLPNTISDIRKRSVLLDFVQDPSSVKSPEASRLLANPNIEGSRVASSLLP